MRSSKQGIIAGQRLVLRILIIYNGRGSLESYVFGLYSVQYTRPLAQNNASRVLGNTASSISESEIRIPGNRFGFNAPRVRGRRKWV